MDNSVVEERNDGSKRNGEENILRKDEISYFLN